MEIKTKFMDLLPDELENGIIYISMNSRTIIHLCACGCGEEVVTPLSPHQWKMKYDGENISLKPSIGNWQYKCKSHYWIKKSKVVWARTWSDKEIRLFFEDGIEPDK